ncbi:Sodium/hydrogen exchanger 4 [Varanus komodoensis]|nr:Sodium/hydrogen exchanger 4 [Varanus komodoensis]
MGSKRYRNQRTRRLGPEEVESIQNILEHNLYQVRQRTLSYNRYNLSTDPSERQAKEILLRQQHSLRQPTKKGYSLPWGGQAAMKSMRYLSLPLRNAQPVRSEARNDDDLTGDCSSDSESVFMKFGSESQPGAHSHRRKWPQQELLPMKQLHSRTKSAGFTGQRRRTNEEDEIARRQRPLLPPKPHQRVALETDIQELEPEDEECQAPFPSGPSIKWTVENRPKRKHFDGPKRHFTQRKEWLPPAPHKRT